MAKQSFGEQLEQRAGRAIVTRSIYRWESAVIIALTMSLALLTLIGVIPALFGIFQWWFWLVLGALGEIGLVWSSVKDPEFRARAVGEMFREKFEPREIKNNALRARVEKALEYRERFDEVIAKSREGVMRDHMADVSQGTTDWMENIFELAKRLDAYMADEMLRQDLQSVEPSIEALKKRLALEEDDTVKRQISQTIAQKQIQRDNLYKLQNVMERAQFQLESTVTAMGTVYSQMMILGSRDVASGRAERLQEDIDDQVQALQDVVQTMDEVYHAGTDPLGLGLSAADIPTLSAQKGIKSN
jgi:tetratricopeptide (TPR) repeat protein